MLIPVFIHLYAHAASDYLHCNLIEKPVSLPVELHSDVFNL
jgi:hypothetical protein